MKVETQISAVKTPTGTIWTTNPNVFPIDGLLYLPRLLSKEEETRTLEIIDSKPFSVAISRRQQFWGEVYYHTTHDITTIQPSTTTHNTESEYKSSQNSSPSPVSALPLSSFQWLFDKLDRIEMEATQEGICTYQGNKFSYGSTPSGLFVNERPTQILVNEYTGQQGIAHHLDDPFAFGHILVMISIGDPIYMTLTLPRGRTKVLLEPGSMVVMKGEARYACVHGITRQKFLMMPNGEWFERGDSFRRVSLTIRQLLDGRKRVNEDSKEWIEGPKVSV